MATLLELRQQVRQRCDIEHSEFIQDAELNQYISNSYKELYDIVTTSYQDNYTVQSGIIPLNDDSGKIPLPNDFYKLRGVDLTIDGGSNWVPLRQFDFQRRNAKNFGAWWYNREYRILNNHVYLTPVDQANGSYRLWYVPKASNLVLDTDTVDGINGWEEYIIVDASIKCKQKSEEEVNDLKETKMQLKARILEASKNRDAGMPQVISDAESGLYGSDFDYWRF